MASELAASHKATGSPFCYRCTSFQLTVEMHLFPDPAHAVLGHELL